MSQNKRIKLKLFCEVIYITAMIIAHLKLFSLPIFSTPRESFLREEHRQKQET